MYFKKLLFTSLFSLCILHAQNGLGLNINNEDLEVQASIDLNANSEYLDSTTFILEGSYLYSDRDDLVTLGISGENSLQGVDGLSLALGAKLIFADDFMSLPFFGTAKYRLPFSEDIPTTSFSTTFAYAPSVLTFSDGESYTEFRAEALMEIISNIHIYTGYRYIDTEYKNNNKTFNDSFYGGMKFKF